MEIYDIIGSFGPWQWKILGIIFYIYALAIWQNLAINFFAPNVPFRCIEPVFPVSMNRSTDQYYDRSCTVPLVADNYSNNVTWVPCTKWEYDTSQFSETIVSEWDLVCDREWLVSLVKSAYLLGFTFSVIFFGQLSDWIGRFKALAISYFVTCASLFLCLLSSSFIMFAILRFLLGFGRLGLTTVGFVLIMEMTGPDHRAIAGVILQVGWSVGFCTLPLLAWFVRHWFWLNVAIALPFAIILFTYGIVPESPRWLMMHQKHEELEKVLTTAARINKKTNFDVKDLESIKSIPDGEDTGKKINVFDMLKMPRMRNRTFNMIYLWVVNAFLYYGLVYNVSDLAGNFYLNFFMAGLIEFPSLFLLYWGIERFGRRPTLLAFMMGAGGSYVAAAFSPQPGSAYAWVNTAFALTGKFCGSAAFSLLNLYTNELYPTVVRNVAVGTCSMFSRLGSLFAPFVRELSLATHPSAPNILYGFLALSSGILAFLFVPETIGRKLPDTLEEGEQLGELEENKTLTLKDKNESHNVRTSCS